MHERVSKRRREREFSTLPRSEGERTEERWKEMDCANELAPIAP